MKGIQTRERRAKEEEENAEEKRQGEKGKRKEERERETDLCTTLTPSIELAYYIRLVKWSRNRKKKKYSSMKR